MLLRRRWPWLTAATLANQLTAYLVFELSLRAVGVSVATVPPSEAFLAWAIGRVISSLPLTPGGIGVVELGMIGTLVGFGASDAHVVAAVLLYRGVIVLPTLVVGLASLPVLRRLGAGRALGKASATSSRGSSTRNRSRTAETIHSSRRKTSEPRRSASSRRRVRAKLRSM